MYTALRTGGEGGGICSERRLYRKMFPVRRVELCPTGRVSLNAFDPWGCVKGQKAWSETHESILFGRMAPVSSWREGRMGGDWRQNLNVTPPSSPFIRYGPPPAVTSWEASRDAGQIDSET